MDGATTGTEKVDLHCGTSVGVGRLARQPVSQFRSILSLADFERKARRRLPWMLYSFIAGGAEDEAALAESAAAFRDYAFVPRVLVDVSRRSQTTSLFGKPYAAPFGIPPMGVGALFAYRNDVVLAHVAESMQLPFILSASSLIPLETVKAAGPNAWYQAYVPGDEPRIAALIDRVAAAGFDTFVVTVDVPVAANRENNERNGFTTPLRPSFKLFWDGATHPSWLFGTALRTLISHGMPHFENTDATRGPPIISRDLTRATGLRDGLSWQHLKFIRSKWAGKLVVKGVLAAADAKIVREAGADGVIVSNHGGRQLDGAIAPLRVLPEIVEASGDMVVMYDGNIRRGADVLKALALGAQFVFVGRPFLFAAAVGGEAGVRHAAELLTREIDRDMAMLGITSLAELTTDHIRRIRE
ncbi:MAG: alpha-hydroxy acid oxidase [Hyphomicrobiaceae bacterium]